MRGAVRKSRDSFLNGLFTQLTGSQKIEIIHIYGGIKLNHNTQIGCLILHMEDFIRTNKVRRYLQKRAER